VLPAAKSPLFPAVVAPVVTDSLLVVVVVVQCSFTKT
jgi:hypothetical protein